MTSKITDPTHMLSIPRGIYMASKTKHAHKWRYLRDVRNVPIVSTWIDEAGVEETEDWEDLSKRCIQEASSADLLIFYQKEGEEHKGSWAEIGAALASNTPVVIAGEGRNIQKSRTIDSHPLVVHSPELFTTIEYGWINE